MSAPTQLGMNLPRLEDCDPVELAVVFATAAHDGVKDRAGRPYILHPLAVAKIVRDGGGSEAEIVAAVLHDVVEDTDYTLDDIRTLFGDEVTDIVDAVTRRSDETRREYIVRAFTHPQGKRVKKADHTSNRDGDRRALLARIDPDAAASLDAKYARDDRYLADAGLSDACL